MNDHSRGPSEKSSTKPQRATGKKRSLSKMPGVTGYQIARAVLLENARLHADPTSDAFRHNLNAALYQLAEAVEADAREIKAQLSRIDALLTARRDRR
jgi:hypothetical protein